MVTIGHKIDSYRCSAYDVINNRLISNYYQIKLINKTSHNDWQQMEKLPH